MQDWEMQREAILAMLYNVIDSGDKDRFEAFVAAMLFEVPDNFLLNIIDIVKDI